MVKISLQIKATLEHVAELYTSHPKFNFCLKIKCLNCGEVSDKWHDVSEEDNITAKAQSKHQNNFAAKCKLCGRENSLDIIENSNGKLLSSDEGNFKTLVTFDCRGLEPIDFSPSKGWLVKVAESPTLYRNVDLSEKEWVEYDEHIKESVGVYELEFQFIKVK